VQADIEVDPMHQPEFFQFTRSLGNGSDRPLLKAMATSTHTGVVGEVVGGARQHHRSCGVREQ
jgi:hypothetical protein